MRFSLRTLIWVATATTIACAGFGIWHRSIDGISGNLLAAIFPCETNYADGYTHEGFRAARIGMTRTEIYSLLGRPLGTWENYGGAETVEWWSDGTGGWDYRMRAIVFRADRATEKISGYGEL